MSDAVAQSSGELGADIYEKLLQWREQLAALQETLLAT